MLISLRNKAKRDPVPEPSHPCEKCSFVGVSHKTLLKHMREGAHKGQRRIFLGMLGKQKID